MECTGYKEWPLHRDEGVRGDVIVRALGLRRRRRERRWRIRQFEMVTDHGTMREREGEGASCARLLAAAATDEREAKLAES